MTDRGSEGRKIGLSVVLLVLFLPALPSLADSASRTIEKLVIGTTMEVKSLSLDDAALSTLRHITTHQGLVYLDDNGQFSGDLAESWRTEDARTWTFTLRADAMWHDGRPVTARDIQYTIEAFVKFIPVYRSHFGLIDSVKAPNDRTLIIDLKQPNPRFLVNLLVLRVVPSHIFQKVDDPRTLNGPEAMVGSGPFVFDFFDPTLGTMGFKAFEKYRRGPPAVKRLQFRFFKNTDTMILALRRGEIDLPYVYASGIAPFYVPALQKDRSLAIHLQQNLGVPAALFFNVHRDPVNLRDFRHALALSIDYQEILNVFGRSYGAIPTKGFVPRGSPDFVDTAPMTCDREEARRLLDALGMTDIDGDGVRERDGRPVQVELMFRGDISGDLRLAQLLQEYFQTVGIRTRLKPVDAAVFRSLSDQDRSHMALLARTTPWGMMMWAGCGSGYMDARYIGWSSSDDPVFTNLVDRMNGTLDPENYRKAAAELQHYYARELPAIALYWNVLIQPYPARLRGWKVSPMYGLLWEESWFGIGLEP